MRLLQFFILVLTINSLTSQELKNGEYISHRTSYQDFLNNENNFVEDTRFNLSIQLRDNGGIIIIQDPRIPEKLLIYKIYAEGKEVSKGNIKAVFYHAYTEHLEISLKTYIGLYRSKGDVLNLMVSDS